MVDVGESQILNQFNKFSCLLLDERSLTGAALWGGVIVRVSTVYEVRRLRVFMLEIFKLTPENFRPSSCCFGLCGLSLVLFPCPFRSSYCSPDFVCAQPDVIFLFLSFLVVGGVYEVAAGGGGEWGAMDGSRGQSIQCLRMHPRMQRRRRPWLHWRLDTTRRFHPMLIIIYVFNCSADCDSS